MRKNILLLIVGILLLLCGLNLMSATIVTSINYSGFESGEQGWTFGGADGDRSNTRSNVTDAGAAGGTWSAHLQDDTTTSFFSRTFNFTGQHSVNISFSFCQTSVSQVHLKNELKKLDGQKKEAVKLKQVVKKPLKEMKK